MSKTLIAMVFGAVITNSHALRTGGVNPKEWERIQQRERELDNNVLAFQKNLEGLRTTVDFGPVDTISN
jgi:hypothetical protein